MTMALNQAQLTALAADIAANSGSGGEFENVPQNSDGAFAIAVAYNLTASPQFVVWKSDLPTKDCKIAMVWTEYIGRSASERDAWQFMLSNGTINAGDVNVRQGIQDIFSGPNGAGTRAALVAIAKRDATRAEALFATGTGSDGSPGTLTFEGNLSFSDVLAAMGW